MSFVSSLTAMMRNPRARLMLALGFSSGLPLYLVGSTLRAWMTNEGISLAKIGLFGLVGTAYACKFAWSPLMDRYFPPFLGRRRGWMLVTQVLLALGLFAMGQVNPRTDAVLMAAFAALVAFFSASQDIAADAYRTELLEETDADRAFGITTFTLGYRIGMVFAMAVALILSDVIGWKGSYTVMAALMSVGIIATLRAPEPKVERPPHTWASAVVHPFLDFFRRYSRERPAALNPVLGFLQRYWLALVILLFLMLFRVGDGFMSQMNTTFILKQGFTNSEVGVIQKGVGMTGAILGALTGGLLVATLGVRRGLFLFGTAQALTNLLYVGLGMVGKNSLFLALTVGLDNFSGGMGGATITVFSTALCSKKFSITQYALLSSLAAVPMQVLGASSGILVESVGWNSFFLLTALAMGPALLVLMLIPRDVGTSAQPEAAAEQLTRPTLAPEAAAELASAAKKSAG
ncbi:AmpG family muropeptide MFS transporter [Hyalangium gracile]|uniref:AmpG family muropeptide MFS transporter n=1 Tax=Hyalangium gracile TaxID=394092 RepID=UPI001CCF91BC|nr:MFS transporter [Hyalangium gracile]